VLHTYAHTAPFARRACCTAIMIQYSLIESTSTPWSYRSPSGGHTQVRPARRRHRLSVPAPVHRFLILQLVRKTPCTVHISLPPLLPVVPVQWHVPVVDVVASAVAQLANPPPTPSPMPLRSCALSSCASAPPCHPKKDPHCTQSVLHLCITRTTPEASGRRARPRSSACRLWHEHRPSRATRQTSVRPGCW